MIHALRHHRLAAIGFLVVCLLGVGARVLNGPVATDALALELYNGLQENSRHLGSAVATSSATILALMLTMIGVVHRVHDELDRKVYPTVSLIAVASASTLAASAVLLLATSLPLEQFALVSDGWHRTLYNAAFAVVVLVSAMIVGVVLMLLTTVLLLVDTVMADTPK